MALKIRAAILFLVIALCALVGVAAAATGTGAGIVDDDIIEPLAEETPVDDKYSYDKYLDDKYSYDKYLDDKYSDYDYSDYESLYAEYLDEEVLDEESLEGLEELVNEILMIEADLLIAAQQFLVEDMAEEEIQSVLKDVYDNIDGVVMVYVISPRGIIEAAYPDEFNAAVGDFIVRSPVGGTVVKAREFFVTNEYTSARENITGYDAVQPIIADSGQYLGAIVAKFSS